MRHRGLISSLIAVSLGILAQASGALAYDGYRILAQSAPDTNFASSSDGVPLMEQISQLERIVLGAGFEQDSLSARLARLESRVVPAEADALSRQSLPVQVDRLWRVVRPGPSGRPVNAQAGYQFQPIQTPSVGQQPGSRELNKKIVDFVNRHMGQQVGDGECWSLAAAAIDAAGAQPPQEYVFGRELGPNEEWWPGDIIQFTSCVFKQPMPKGGWEIFEAGVPNHTAVYLGRRDGKVLIGQQNVLGNRTVQTGLIDFNCMISGNYKVYRTLPAGGL